MPQDDPVVSESETLESHARLAAVLNSLTEGVVVSDLRGRVLEMNPVALSMHGMQHREEGQRELEEFTEFELSEVDGPPLPQSDWPLARAVRGETFTDLELELRHKPSGKVSLISYSGALVHDDAGKPIACVLTMRDISARKEAEKALQASEAQLNAIVEHAAVGIVFLSLPDRRILHVNEAFCRMIGYRRGEFIGLTSLDITHPDDRQIGMMEYDALLARKQTGFTLEKRYLRKDGSTIWANLTVSAVQREHEPPAYAIVIIQDVTAARQAEFARGEAERRLQMALDIAQLGAWEWDFATDRLQISDSWKARLGVAAAAPQDLADAWRERIHPDDVERATAYICDFLNNPHGAYELEYRVRHADGAYRWITSRAIPVFDENGKLAKLLGTHLDITERKEAEQRIRQQSMHDQLTGLPNRALLLEYGAHLLAAGPRQHGRCALLFVDLDRFKPINDTYGHEAGDAVLREVARRLLHCTRKEDLVGRLGGDEFVVLLPHIDDDHRRALVVAQHVIDVIGRPIFINDLELSVLPSIGISYYPEQGADIETLLRMADLAMYQAKQAGRATYREYTQEMDAHASDLHAWECMVRATLRERGLVVHYQPVVDVRDNHVVAAEALVRMVGPDGHTVSPLDFVPIAEASGQIVDLGDWVMNTACRQHEDWLREGLPPMMVSVNVSPLDFGQPDFARRLGVIVAASGIDPGSLQVEVPESVMQTSESLAGTFREVKSLGVKIALDNFGGGLSNLGQLPDLPIDRLKISRSLVRRLGDPAGEALMKAIIALGQTMHIDVVGEGVESEDMLRLLRDSGCDEAQGFLLSHPLPAEAFAAWCRGHVH